MSEPNWLNEFMERERETPGHSCSCSRDCDRERQSALAEIQRLRAVTAWASGQLDSYEPDLLRVQEVLTEETPTREMFFAVLPDWDFEVNGGTLDHPRWAWEDHPWFAYLGITREECEAFWEERNERDE